MTASDRSGSEDETTRPPESLNVVIEAPVAAMTEVLAAHDDVRELCDNGWLHLLAMGDDGRVTHRYAGDLAWEELPA